MRWSRAVTQRRARRSARCAWRRTRWRGCARRRPPKKFRFRLARIACMVKACRLESAGIEVFNHGSGETLSTSIASAYEDKKPWFGYYWGPTAVLGKYKMTKITIGDIDTKIHSGNQNKDNANPGVSDFPPAPVLTVITSAFKKRANQPRSSHRASRRAPSTHRPLPLPLNSRPHRTGSNQPRRRRGNRSSCGSPSSSGSRPVANAQIRVGTPSPPRLVAKSRSDSSIARRLTPVPRPPDSTQVLPAPQDARAQP